MKYFLSLTMLGLLLSCSAQTSDHSGEEMAMVQSSGIFTDVDNDEAKKLMAERPDLQIIDVRTDGEVAEGIIKGAQHIDISKDDFDAKLNKLDKSAPVLVYCAAGGRSKTAQDKMKELGFSEVHNLKRGYRGWK